MKSNDDFLREIYDERAGIAEFCGGMTREQAEAIAEAERAECEARHVAGMSGNVERADYINQVAKARGPVAAQSLRVAAYREMRKGGQC